MAIMPERTVEKSKPHFRRLRRWAFASLAAFALLVSAAPSPVKAEDVIQAPQAFLENAFGGEPPKAQVLWLKRDLQSGIQKIMDHRLNAVRLRYWRSGERSAWILEEIGKEQPITAGFVVDKNRIMAASVLTYRESRGWEIKYPAFRNQFIGAMLEPNTYLDRNIDGISGATMSVTAMMKMARLALYLHSHVVAASIDGAPS